MHEYIEINGLNYENNYLKEEEAQLVYKIMNDRQMNQRSKKINHSDMFDNFKVIMKHVKNPLSYLLESRRTLTYWINLEMV